MSVDCPDKVHFIFQKSEINGTDLFSGTISILVLICKQRNLAGVQEGTVWYDTSSSELDSLHRPVTQAWGPWWKQLQHHEPWLPFRDRHGETALVQFAQSVCLDRKGRSFFAAKEDTFLAPRTIFFAVDAFPGVKYLRSSMCLHSGPA